MDSQEEQTVRLDPQWVWTVRLDHCYCLVAMDTIVLVEGTVEPPLFQGRAVVILTDMGTVGVVLLGSLGVEHNPLEGVGGGLASDGKTPDGRGEGNAELLLALWYEENVEPRQAVWYEENVEPLLAV